MTLTPNQCHGILDEKGLLDDAAGPGTYALRVETPNSVESVARAFRRVSDVVPPDGDCALLTASDVAYVGASGNVYDRLMDHARSDVRKATFLQAFDPLDVVDVWPAESTQAAFQNEYNRAVALRNSGVTVWCDGRVV